MLGSNAKPADWQPFLTIADHLRTQALAAPALLLDLSAQGVLVFEDLGADTFAAWLTVHPGQEEVLYVAAVDVLVRLQDMPAPPGLIALNPTRAAGMIAPLFDHYATGHDARTVARLTGTLQEALATHAPQAPDAVAARFPRREPDLAP